MFSLRACLEKMDAQNSQIDGHQISQIYNFFGLVDHISEECKEYVNNQYNNTKL